ncbi:SusC/RagA family TonB-linked outer membrane protein [Chitinophaga sp. sic0106]|uniref:SusC/RagA family TonB-linked outer membrane protein n=1 Tax=Chitinophaga sp. sic0106 TaxID=2854785 RepID=UPI001C471FDA|nr:SusC/RagA family TonB-linked outer membrane protein [Chitinophaga sp. sic0106]MBV7533448.1 SusC/RagA family TonB-linked outer membrane protein [Chitinophaga sp. sic0106]
MKIKIDARRHSFAHTRTGRILRMLAGCLLLLCYFPAFAQEPGETRVSVNFNNISLKQAFKEMETQGKVKFVFNDESIAPYRVTLKADNQPLKAVIGNLLKNTSLDFQLRDNKVIIMERKKTGAVKMTMMQAQPTSVPATTLSMRRVRGKVLAADNNGPLPTATISARGAEGQHSVTDAQGEFVISLPPSARVLVITHIGYTPKEVVIGASESYVITLDVSQEKLNEVVVMGPFNRKAESFTGSSVTFTQEQLRAAGNQTLIQSLKILDPSFVQVVDNIAGSDPNTLPNLQIRGGSSLPGLQGEYSSMANAPLFILDGFETTLEKIYDLDMNRVASVTLLKDATAKAIYGSKAANGVVVVETKRPQAGKLRVSYTADLKVTAPDLSSYKLANASEKLQAEVNAGRYKSSYYHTTQALAEQYNTNYAAVVRGVNTDWLAQPVRTGIGQKHTISLEGGDEFFRYGADLSYNDTKGAMIGSDRKTTSVAVLLSYRVKKFVFRNNLTVGFNRSDDSPYGSFAQYSRLNPYWSPFDDNGNLKRVLGTFSTGSGTSNTYYNPMYDATIGTKNFSRYTDINNNFQAEWNLASSLKLVGRFSYNLHQSSREDFYPANSTRYTEYPDSMFFLRGDYTITDGRDVSLRSDLTLNYSRQLGDHLFFLNAGWNVADDAGETHGLQAQGFLNDRVDNISFAKQYLQNGRPLGTDAKSRETGLLSALNYSYDDRFLADLSYRRQGSSIFGADNKWGSFWSAGIGWNLHHERFLKDVSWLNQFKLRSSTGYTGSQNFNPYQAMSTYTYYTDTYYDNVVGAKLMALANKELKWQETQDYNIGVDLKAFERLSLRFDYFISNTNNLLTDLPLPGSTGFSTIKENLGGVQNKGIDATLSLKVMADRKTGSFLNLFVSAAGYKNKLVRISNALKSLNDQKEAARAASGATAPFIRYKEGESTTAIYAVQSLGVDPSTGREIFLKANGDKTFIWNADDQVRIGDSNPLLNGSFGFNTQYRGWGLNCAFTYRIGGQYYNQTLVDRVENVDIQYNVDQRVFSDTWKQAGDQSFFKAITTLPNRTLPTSRFVQDLNELVLSSLNITYDFKNAPFLKKSKMQRLRATLFTGDLFVLSSVKAERGLSYPYARTLSFSVQATF